MVVSSITMHGKTINILVMILPYSVVFFCTNNTMEMIWREQWIAQQAEDDWYFQFLDGIVELNTV